VTLQPFEEIVALHGPAVMRVCRALLGSGGSSDAQDAWSDTFLSALKAYPRLRPRSNVRGWLVTIARRKAIDQIRARARAPRPSAEVPEVPDAAPEPHAPSQPDAALRAALEALPAKQRGAVVYRYLADLPYAEVAALLGGSEAAARRSAADGIARLRKSLRREPA
jgi:RNA polymerase sigma factor (sigma-70 family)